MYGARIIFQFVFDADNYCFKAIWNNLFSKYNDNNNCLGNIQLFIFQYRTSKFILNYFVPTANSKFRLWSLNHFICLVIQDWAFNWDSRFYESGAARSLICNITIPCGYKKERTDAGAEIYASLADAHWHTLNDIKNSAYELVIEHIHYHSVLIIVNYDSDCAQ